MTLVWLLKGRGSVNFMLSWGRLTWESVFVELNGSGEMAEPMEVYDGFIKSFLPMYSPEPGK